MKKEKAIYLHGHNIENAPGYIRFISYYWTEKANRYGDSGSCVIGAYMEFRYQGQKYQLSPMSKWQGSISWEHCQKEIQEKLKQIGATEIRFNYGVMD